MLAIMANHAERVIGGIVVAFPPRRARFQRLDRAGPGTSVWIKLPTGSVVASSGLTHTGPQHEAERGEFSQDGSDSLALGCGCGTRQDPWSVR